MSMIGSSRLGLPIYSYSIGASRPARHILVVASIHGREYANGEIMCRLQPILRQYHGLLKRKNICFTCIPFANPDGIAKAKHFPHYRWKANAAGVDLNRNFPCGFRKGSSDSYAAKPGGSYYPGPYAASEPETISLMHYIASLPNLCAVISLHSQGRCIFWNYNVPSPLRDRQIWLMNTASKATGYRPIPDRLGTKPCGGLGEWCVHALGIPSITLETGRFLTPIPTYQYLNIQDELFSFFRLLFIKFPESGCL